MSDLNAKPEFDTPRQLDDLHLPFDPETDVWMLTPSGLRVGVLAQFVADAEGKLGWTRIEGGA